MQVLRQALLQSLPAQIMQFTVIRNKILCLTQNQLILLCIDAICKKSQIPYNGSCVYKMQMSKDYIALLQRTGRLEIRRVDNLSQVVLVDKSVRIVNNQYPRLKWWQDDLHLVYQKHFITINALATTIYSDSNSKEKEQKHISVQTGKEKQLLQVQFSDLFSQTRSFFHVFKSEVILSINSNINIASIEVGDGQEIKQVIRLCHPFQQNQFNKQYLVVLVEKIVQKNTTIVNDNSNSNRNVLPSQSPSASTLSKQQQQKHKQKSAANKKSLPSQSTITITSPLVVKQKSITLRVYNILTLGKIFQKHLLTTSSLTLIQVQPIHTEILTDQLSQYLLIKHYKYTKSTKTHPYPQKLIQTQTLLKVNTQYYYSQSKSYQEHYQPFFMFQIEIGLKKDLKLFPSHSQQIAGKMCDSIDTCYFENNQVHIASIVLETGYKNDIYHKWKNIDIVIQHQQEQEFYNNQHQQQSSQLMIWRQLVQAKIDPNKFIQKLINASQLNKYHSKNHHSNTINKQQQKSQNNQKQSSIVSNKNDIIGVQHQNILNSLLTKLHKINNFHLLNQKIDAYQTMKKILAIEYFPMLLDVMTIERDDNKKERQILQKSNQDASKTMSGCSSSGPQSPRSDNSAILILPNENENKNGSKEKAKKITLKDLSIINDNDNIVNPQKLSTEVDRNHSKNDNDDQCFHCMQIEDHQNLQLTLQIMNQSSKTSDSALQQIQQSIHNMQTLTKYRLQKIQMKTRKEKKQSNNIVSFIENQFNESLKNLHETLLDSANKFIQKISFMPDKSIQKISEKQEQFVQTIEEKRMLYDNSAKIHKQNHQQLLDYLYDIEFPQVDLQNQPKTDNMFDFFNISDLSKSLLSKSYGLDRTINEMNMSKEKTEEQFRLFSEFVLKNFI